MAPEFNAGDYEEPGTTSGRLWIMIRHLSFFARWEMDSAPRTCELFRSLLPLRMKIIHCSWSGEGVWVPLGKWESQWLKENRTSHPKPGELLLYAGGLSEPELLIPCGTCVFNSKSGMLSGNHFATISDGVESLTELRQLLLWQGAQDCVIENLVTT